MMEILTEASRSHDNSVESSTMLARGRPGGYLGHIIVDMDTNPGNSNAEINCKWQTNNINLVL